MAELTTADPILLPEDDDIFAVRKAGVTGLLKMKLLQIRSYLNLPLLSTGVAGQALLLNAAGDGIEFGDVAAGGGGGGTPVPAVPAIRGVTGPTAFNANTINISLPAGALADDFALIFVGHGWNAVAPAGFTTVDNSTGANWNGATYSGLLTPAHISAGYVTVGFAGSYNGVASMVVYKGGAVAVATGAAFLRSGTGASTELLDSGALASTLSVILFGSNRANSVNTIDKGTVIGAGAVAATDSSAIVKEAKPAAGVLSATFSYATPGMGNYQAIVPVKSLSGGGGLPTELLPIIVLQDKRPAATAYGTAVASAWTAKILQTQQINTIEGASLASNQVTLPKGSYSASGWSSMFRANKGALRLRDITNGVTLLNGQSAYSETLNNGGAMLLDGAFVLAAETIVELQYYIFSIDGGTQALGFSGVSGEPDVHSSLRIQKLNVALSGSGDSGGGSTQVSAKFWRLRVSRKVGTTPAVGEVIFKDALGTSLISGGTPISSTNYDGTYTAAKAFDGVTTGDNAWYSATGRGVNEWIGYSFATPVTVEQVEVFPYGTTPADTPLELQVDYSNDGVVWMPHALLLPAAWVAGAGQSFTIPPINSSGGGSGPFEFIAEHSPSAATVLDIPLPSDCVSYQIEIESFKPSLADTAFHAQFTKDAFATIENGASDYKWLVERRNTFGVGVPNSNGDTKMVLVDSVNNSDAGIFRGTLKIIGAKSSDCQAGTTLLGGVSSDGTIPEVVTHSGTLRKLDVVNGIRITTNKGTFSGKVRVFGLKAVPSSGGGSGRPWFWSPPLAADFPTAIGSSPAPVALEDDSDVGLIFDGGAPTSGDRVVGWGKAVPAGDWSVTTRIVGFISGSNYSGMGLVVTNGLLTKSTMMRIDGRGFYMADFNLPAGFAADLYGVYHYGIANPFMRLEYISATNTLVWLMSNDGKKFAEIYRSVLSFITAPAYVGPSVGWNRTGGSPVNFSMDHWEQSW